MARPKGSVNKIREITKTVDEFGNVQNEEIAEKEEIVPETEVDVFDIQAEREEIAKEREALKQGMAELAELKNKYEIKTLDECMKDKFYGSRVYLKINKSVSTDQNGRPLYVAANLSCFPDTINKRTGEYLAPDIGFDSREEADEFRNSKEKLTSYKGKLTPICDVIADLRNEYHRKRTEGDQRHIAQQNLSNGRN
jgi:hypothetical protein